MKAKRMYSTIELKATQAGATSTHSLKFLSPIDWAVEDNFAGVQLGLKSKIKHVK